MAVSFGFYNSIGGDRKYDAVQMNRMFDGILTDGVFIKVGDKFNITAGSGMSVDVGTGRAWFRNTWTYNDSVLPLTIDISDITLHRIDTIILEVNSDDMFRANSIKVLKGENASSPVPKPLVRGDELNQYALGYIRVDAKVENILDSHITMVTGQEQTPWVRGLLDEEALADIAIPVGLISMWSGSIGAIPEGWSLCDGKNNTPDLRNRFIVGAGEEYSVGGVGGSKEVVLTSNEIPSHSHGAGTLSTNYAGSHSHTVDVRDMVYNADRGISGYVQLGATSYEVSTNYAGSHSHTLSGSTGSVGSGASHENRPPYFALAYIMKL